MQILNGKECSSKISNKLKELINDLTSPPCLAVILIGDNPSSHIYVRIKKRKCTELGIISKEYKFDTSITTNEVIQNIQDINKNPDIHGILVQLPLPEHLDTKKILETIHPYKDVDGLTDINYGKLLNDDDTLAPCTPKGIMRLLEYHDIDLKGKNVVIINDSKIVGKPLVLMMLNKLATVTVCHKFTNNLNEHTLRADIVVVGVGIKDFLKPDMIKNNAIVVDVGINKVGKKIYGDCHEDIKNKCSFMTPVPGGVGPMTVITLMINTYNGYLLKDLVVN